MPPIYITLHLMRNRFILPNSVLYNLIMMPVSVSFDVDGSWVGNELGKTVQGSKRKKTKTKII